MFVVCVCAYRLNVFIVSASGGQKPQFLANFDIFGLLYRPPFTDDGKIWCAIADPRYTLTCQTSSRSVYYVELCWRKTPFLRFFGHGHLVASPTGNNLKKLNTGAQLQTFPYPTASKLFLYSNAFMAKSRAHYIWRSKAWRTNRQTDRQKLNVFGHPGAGWNPSPPNLAWW